MQALFYFVVMMNLPFFYAPDLTAEGHSLLLDENNSRHAVQVLRMQAGDQLLLTNGRGLQALAQIAEAHKKQSSLQIMSREEKKPSSLRKTAIAISPVKNNSRFEWFLEKATELGVTEIFPTICHRTEREHFRHDRLNAICISAMLQSQQAWLPVLHTPLALPQLIETPEIKAYHQKWVAHCMEMEKHQLSHSLQPTMTDSLILIGPEGDFTAEEVVTVTGRGFVPVSLGHTRLRTETAGVAAAVLMQLV